MRGARPLEGLRIIELSALVAPPLGGMTLAELGAEVIRIDPPAVVSTSLAGHWRRGEPACSGQV